MTNFVKVNEIFTSRGLELIPLNILVPNERLYETMAIQPTGRIRISSDFIGHSDQGSATSQFLDFFRIAIEKNCDLVLAPEYSCPWEAISTQLTRQLLPQQGKLWAIGCESITPEQLAAFEREHQNVIWIHEPIPQSSGHILDVLVYITKAQTSTGIKDVILLQFKTLPMGGTDTFERDSLICGSQIYIWHNPHDNIRFLSLICSEALVFNETAIDQCRFDLHAYIIFHPQLSTNPRQSDICNYRSLIYSQRLSDNYEVISLNWARGFILPGQMPSSNGGSAVFTKSPEFNFDDMRLNSNHKKGLYFTYWYEKRTQLCIFNYDQLVFHFRMPKTRQDTLAVLARRTGPQMIAVWSWDSGARSWQNCHDVDDGFSTLCSGFRRGDCDYCLGVPHTAIDRERLLTLSAGKLNPARDWHSVKKMDSFIADRDERSKRLTFTHELLSNDFRWEYLGRFIRLQTEILNDPSNFPETIHDLCNNWRLLPPTQASEYRFNLIGNSDNIQGATAMFLATLPPESAKELMDKIIREWSREKTRRLVIWYEYNNQFKRICPELPSITDDSELPDSIARSVSQ